MAVPTLDQLFAPLSRDEIMSSILAVAADLDLPITAWQSGSVGREIFETIAQKIADNTQTGALAASGGLLSYSSSDWLTLLAFELYEVTRTPATSGTTTLRMTNASGIGYTLAAGEVRAVNQITGATYTSTTGGVLAASGGTLDVTIQADEPGTESNAATGDINALVTPLFGVTVTNPDPLVGTDEMSDADLKTLCRESLAKASPNGPKDAYAYFAKTATRSDGSNIGVTRVTVVQGNGTNYVYLASADGVVEASDVALVNTRIQENVVPTGFTAVVESAVSQDVTIQATVYMAQTATVTDSEAQTLILAQLLAYFATIPIGGNSAGSFTNVIFLEPIIGQIFEAIEGQIVETQITSHTAPISIGTTSVAVLQSVAADFTILPAGV